MEITWLGHSCFRLRGKDATVVTDPCDKKTGYNISRPTADIVTVSHDHPAHNNVAGVAGTPRVIQGPGEFEVSGVLIQGIPTFHPDVEPGGTQAVPNVAVERLDVDAHLVEAGLGHLGGHRALPDHRVQAELIAVERARHARRGAEHARGPHGLVRLLGVARLRLVPTELGQRVCVAVVGLHELGDLAECGLGDVHRVGPHIGDEPDGALARLPFEILPADAPLLAAQDSR